MADGQAANPAPLGLAGFGLTTVVLSCMNAGLFPAEASTVEDWRRLSRECWNTGAAIRLEQLRSFPTARSGGGMHCCSGQWAPGGSNPHIRPVSESRFCYGEFSPFICGSRRFA